MTLWFTWYAEVIIEIEGMLQQRYEQALFPRKTRKEHLQCELALCLQHCKELCQKQDGFKFIQEDLLGDNFFAHMASINSVTFQKKQPLSL